jgi:hypothetical protein
MSFGSVFFALLGLAALVVAGFGAQYAMRRADQRMALMDHLHNHPGKRPFPVDRPW